MLELKLTFFLILLNLNSCIYSPFFSVIQGGIGADVSAFWLFVQNVIFSFLEK